MTEKPLEQMGLRDLRAIARQQMPAEAWHHFNGAAETKATFYRNPRSFHRYLFRQRIFHDIADPDINMELFGHKLPIPAMVAPVGSFSLIGDHKEQEVAAGRRSRRSHGILQSSGQIQSEELARRNEIAAGLYGLHEPRTSRGL